MKLECMSWAEVDKYFLTNDIVLIPLGATESHGSHLALGTDFLVPQKIIELLESKVDILSTPVLPFGMSDQHKGFSGTLSIGCDGLYTVLGKITDDLYRYGARRFVFINGHGGNDPVISRVGSDLYSRGAIAACLNWWTIAGELNPKWKGGHGGAEETSAMLAIDEKLYKPTLLKNLVTKNLCKELPCSGAKFVSLRGISIPVYSNFKAVTNDGWFGNDHPNTASKEWGDEMLKAVTDFFAEFLSKFQPV